MTGRPAVQVENLSKEYVIGGPARAGTTLKETVFNGFAAPLRRLRHLRGAAPESERFWALRDVNFEVQRGEVIGIIGANGAGKSTLLKILSRITEPTSGHARVWGRVASLLEVGTGFHPELTGRENVFLNGAILGMSRREIRAKFDEIVSFAEVEKFIDTPVKRYSSGMYVRLAFAVAAHLEPEVLVVDEVLAVGDAAFQKKCLGKMDEVGKAGRTILFVSHNMVAIRRLCSKALLLREGQTVEFGDAAAVTESYLQAALLDQGRAGLQSGQLYCADPADIVEPYQILSIEMLGEDGRPLTVLGTWDYVRFRIRYRAKKLLPNGSVVIKVQNMDGIPLILTSTRPDHTMAMRIEPGDHCIDCVFSRWPLSEGRYTLGAGLAIPGLEYLGWCDNLCELRITARDIYDSGLAPASNRYHVATEHHWEIPSAEVVSARKLFG